ncbi:MAG: DNA-3-methyladenine glycosylase 2 family protein [Candidatus Dormibacteraeota bacterium]|nr:DNA-3-methyladenine glycosylase 2 family protein [Candidatus Dormibacteraeota bacterium]
MTRVRGRELWRATRTPFGLGAERLRQAADGSIEVEAWGLGAAWLLDQAPALAGALDDDTGFEPEQPLLRELHRHHRGLRIGRTSAVVEAAWATVIEQKVAGAEAWAGWRAMIWALGEPAPGPLGLRLPPSPERVAQTPYEVFHRFGIERRRAETVRRVAAHASRLEETLDMPPDAARRRLQALPGMGPWSAAEVALVALGDPDAVSVGDFHLPNQVAWALAGEARGDDERMLELLEPYRGHRARVLRLLEAERIYAPRRGPRMRLRDFRRM